MRVLKRAHLSCYRRIEVALRKLQTKFRDYKAWQVSLRRRDVQEGWAHTEKPRKLLLALTYVLVVLYICMCIYALLIYGTSLGHAPTRFRVCMHVC